MPTYKRAAVEFVRGEGARLWDDAGNAYLDFFAGLGVMNAGHCHPRITEAIREQAGRLVGVSNLYYSQPGVRLAERLSDSSLGGRVFLCNSGAEANECAIKLARRNAHARGVERPEIVVLDGAFHGRTVATLDRFAEDRPRGPLRPASARICHGAARRPRRARGGGWGEHRRGADRADPGRGRRSPDPRAGRRRGSRGLRRVGSTARARRDPDRDGEDRVAVGVGAGGRLDRT